MAETAPTTTSAPIAADDTEADDVRARSVAAADAMDEMTPTPTQAELDRMKRGEHHADASKKGGYNTRQTKAG